MDVFLKTEMQRNQLPRFMDACRSIPTLAGNSHLQVAMHSLSRRERTVVPQRSPHKRNPPLARSRLSILGLVILGLSLRGRGYKTEWTTSTFRFLLVVMAILMTLQPSFADDAKILHGEREAFQLRLDLIRQAQRTIDVAYYEVNDDDVSGQILCSLREAARRGVSVRLIVDGHVGSNTLPKALVEYLIENGVCIRERPVDVRYQLEIGRPRLHDKLLIIDGEQLITGGRNLRQEYFGIGEKRYIDRDIHIRGNAAVNAATYFDQRWNECLVATPSLYRKEKSKVEAKQKHPEWNHMDRDIAKALCGEWLDERCDAPVLCCDALPCSMEFPSIALDTCNVRFLHDCVGGSKNDPQAIAPQILSMINRARSSIEIESPYIVVSNRLQRALTDAANRGVRIRILTNSLKSTDQVIVHAGFANERRWMLREGIEIYEYNHCDTLHAKALIIDQCTSMIGSYNFDMLSEKRNSEVAIVVHDQEFARQLSQSLESHRSYAKQIHRGELFRYEARESSVAPKEFREFRRLRFAAPIAKPFL